MGDKDGNRANRLNVRMNYVDYNRMVSYSVLHAFPTFTEDLLFCNKLSARKAYLDLRLHGGRSQISVYCWRS